MTHLVAHEDDLERAVRAALDLMDAVRSLGPDITARAGVLTGEAAVTMGATNQGMVAGDIVNTASRLQAAAAPGTVLVGEATRHAASAAVAFEPAGPQSLRGKASPIPAWRALRVVAEVGGRRRASTMEAPFVGRHDELRLLKELFHATSREQRTLRGAACGRPGGTHPVRPPRPHTLRGQGRPGSSGGDAAPYRRCGGDSGGSGEEAAVEDVTSDAGYVAPRRACPRCEPRSRAANRLASSARSRWYHPGAHD